MTIRVRGNTFLVDVKVAADRNPTGQEVRVRKAAPTKEEAIRLEALIRAEVIRTGRFVGLDADGVPQQKPSIVTGKKQGTLQDALDLTVNHPTDGWAKQRAGRIQEGNAAQVVAILGPDTLCREITEADFNRAAEVFYSRGNSNDTVARKLQAFSRTLYFARKAGWIRGRVEWERPTPGKPRQFVFTPDLEAQTVAYFERVEADQQMARMFTLGIDTGARLGELLNLEARDVNLKERWALLRETKNGEARTVILYDRAVATLKALCAEHPDGPLFPGWNKKRVSRRMQMAREALGHEGNREFTFHATRHTALTRLAEQGVEFAAMMDQAGHKSPSMTKRYVKLNPVARRRAILASVGQGQQPVAPVAANSEAAERALRAYRTLVATGMTDEEARSIMDPALVAVLPQAVAS